MSRAARQRPGLGLPAFGSLALHAAVALTLFVVRPAGPAITAPVYKVDLVAAPPGPRAAGVVTPPAAPAPEPPQPAPPPPRPVESPKMMPAPPKPVPQKPPPRKAPAPATPTPTPAPRPAKTPPKPAGGGPTGGRGADVVTVHTQGIEFPYPGYLSNIVRQIALNFHENPNAPVTAEVAFLIHRDGSISDVRFVRRSGAYAFDLEAQGAVEAAGSSRAFGPLPDGFPDDVLPVVFSFDPKVLR